MTSRAQAKIVFAVIFGAISSSFQKTSVAAGDTLENKEIMTKCKGDTLALNKPISGVTSHHVYVFRNGDSVASTSVPATGQLKGRLLVNADSSVVLSNLSSGDLGVYRVEVKVSEEKSTERSVRLLVGEPPETVDGKLMAMLDTSNDTVIGLKCGLFTSLGYPPVSAIWKDPAGQLLASTGFTGAYFTLDLPVDIARSGRYCCRLDCGDRNFCCLDDRSPLRQCAPIDVQTDRKTQNAKCVTEETALEKNFDRLERRVSAMDTIVQELEKSERQQQSQMCVAAMFYQVQREAKCEQLDSSVDKLLELQGELWDELNATKSNLSRTLQQSASVGATLTEASLTSKMSVGINEIKGRLSISGQVLAELQTTINEDVINYLYNINQSTNAMQSWLRDDIARVHDKEKETVKFELTTVSDELIQINGNLSSLFQRSATAETGLKQELVKQQRNMEIWMSRISDELNITKNKLSNMLTQTARGQDTLPSEISRQLHETGSRVSKVSGELKQINQTLTTFSQLVATLDRKMESRVSEMNTKMASIEKSLQTHMNNITDFHRTFRMPYSALIEARCADMKYTLHGTRCLKYYATQTVQPRAEMTCAADGGHLVHLKSREDFPPFIALLGQHGRQLINGWKNGLWVGADDIATEGTFTWSDGTILSSYSDVWFSGQPDGDKGAADCVQAVFFDRLFLNDLPCQEQLDFVCEIDLMSL